MLTEKVTTDVYWQPVAGKNKAFDAMWITEHFSQTNTVFYNIYFFQMTVAV